jgi:hypothetical protein
MRLHAGGSGIPLPYRLTQLIQKYNQVNSTKTDFTKVRNVPGDVQNGYDCWVGQYPGYASDLSDIMHHLDDVFPVLL